MQREDNDLGERRRQRCARSRTERSRTSPRGGDDAPIVRYVNSLIDQAIQNRASDLHIEPTEDDLRVRYRIDGVLHEVDTVPQAVQSALISRLEDHVERRHHRAPGPAERPHHRPARTQRVVDLRTATLPTVWGEKIVLRVLDTGGIDLDLKKLGFSEHNYEPLLGARSPSRTAWCS